MKNNPLFVSGVDFANLFRAFMIKYLREIPAGTTIQYVGGT